MKIDEIVMEINTSDKNTSKKYATVIRQNIPEAIRIRCILLPIVGGLLGYNYLALDLPGASGLLSATGPFSGFIVAIITGASAFVFTQIWCQKHLTEKK